MKTLQRMMMMAAVLTAIAVPAPAAKPRSTNTSERAYVITHSQAIDGVCYDSARCELTNFFRSGTAYVYRDVPEPVFRAFLRAESPGRYYHEQVRGKYTSHRMTEQELVMLVDRHDGRTGW